MENTTFKSRMYKFALEIIGLIDKLDKKDIVARVIGDQLLRSGTSVAANYFEASSSVSKKEFAKYLAISLKSGNESNFWLDLLVDSKRASKEQTDWLRDEVNQLTKMLAASIIKIKKQG